jgi:hypothetical protein
MAVPNIFGTATAAIPLSQLDQNFATAITLGNTAVYLGNTTTSLGNVTLTNVTISSVATAFPNNYLANSTVTLGNATLTLGGTTSTVGNLTVTNTTVTEMRETATISATAATGTVDYDALAQVVLYYTTDASGNFTVNFRGNSGTSLDSVMSTGESLSATFLSDQWRYCLLQLCCTGRRFFSHSQVARRHCTDKWQCKLN